MEVKVHVISVPDLLCGSQQGGEQLVDTMTQLQERRCRLQTLLNNRLAELRRVCLQEAELTGELPGDFPLETGERRPYVRRRVRSYSHGPKTIIKTEEEDTCQRKPKKSLFSSALRRHVDSDQHQAHIKRTVHRGCHTDDTVNSESSSISDSTGDRDNDELTPVEIYYALRTTTPHNSLVHSASPRRTLPRSISNVEGTSVPDTQLLARNGTTTVRNHISSDISSGTTNKQWSTPVVLPQSLDVGSSSGPSSGTSSGLSSDPSSGLSSGLSSDPSSGPSSGSYEGGGSCPYSNQQRSSSSEALLDRTTSCNEGGHGQVQGQNSRGMPIRGGPPYKSSEALTDGHLRQLNVQKSSPERQLVNRHGVEHNRLVGRVSVGVRGRGRGDRGGYSDILMDYVWWKQQRQVEQFHGNGKFPSSVPASSLSHFNGYPHHHPKPQRHLSGSQPLHLSEGPPTYRSPLMLRGKPGEPRRVKVTRTKSCGPFIPLQQHQQEAVLSSSSSSSFDPPLPPSSSSSSSTRTSTAALYPQQGFGVESHQHQLDSGSGPSTDLNNNHRLRPPLYSDSITPDDPTRSLHKALALEGLRDWYLRNTLGGLEAGVGVKVRTTNSLHESHPHQLPHQPEAYQGDYHPCQLPQSQTFQGQPLRGRLVCGVVSVPGLLPIPDAGADPERTQHCQR